MTASKSFVMDEQDYEMEVQLLDSNGNEVTGATVDYEIRLASDNSLVDSGTLVEVGSTGIYTKSYAFSLGVGVTQKEFRILYTSTGFATTVESLTVADLAQVIEIEITADLEALLEEFAIGGKII